MSKAQKNQNGSSRRRAELGERMVVYLPPDLAGDLRMKCARERRSLSDAVTAAVADMISRDRITSVVAAFTDMKGAMEQIELLHRGGAR